MSDVKQVICMRYKYPDGKGGMRKLRLGKLIAQGSHASIAWLTNRIQASGDKPVKLRDVEQYWIKRRFTKICVRVDTDEELLDIYNRSIEAGLMVHLITDSGLTEFHGESTRTCLAIGPEWGEDIDAITGDLQLL